MHNSELYTSALYKNYIDMKEVIIAVSFYKALDENKRFGPGQEN